jgi:hypothetical protein
MDRLNAERAGVADGENMLVEDCAYTVPTGSSVQDTALHLSEIEPKPRFTTDMVIGSSAVED